MVAQSKIDSLFLKADTIAVMDSLMSDFESFLDSLTQPKSMWYAGIGIGSGYFSFEKANSVYVSTEKKMMLSPTIGYMHKTGWSLSAAGYGILNNARMNMYQLAVSPSFDRIRSNYSTGAAYTHYFTKDSVSFYTTPIHNELYTYFTYKIKGFRPTLSVNFGWGSKTDFEQQKKLRWSQRLERYEGYYVNVKNVTSVTDLSLTFSLRKNFDWYDVLSEGDNITLTPVALLSAGTQQFGFNTSYSYTYNTIRANSLPSNSTVSNYNSLALQSAGAILKAGYTKGKLMIQPQVYFDYFLQPISGNPLNTVFSVNFNVTF